MCLSFGGEQRVTSKPGGCLGRIVALFVERIFVKAHGVYICNSGRQGEKPQNSRLNPSFPRIGQEVVLPLVGDSDSAAIACHTKYTLMP